MGTTERKLKILKDLCRAKNARMPQLAEKFGVPSEASNAIFWKLKPLVAFPIMSVVENTMEACV